MCWCAVKKLLTHSLTHSGHWKIFGFLNIQIWVSVQKPFKPVITSWEFFCENPLRPCSLAKVYAMHWMSFLVIGNPAADIFWWQEPTHQLRKNCWTTRRWAITCNFAINSSTKCLIWNLPCPGNCTNWLFRFSNTFTTFLLPPLLHCTLHPHSTPGVEFLSSMAVFSDSIPLQYVNTVYGMSNVNMLRLGLLAFAASSSSRLIASHAKSTKHITVHPH